MFNLFAKQYTLYKKQRLIILLAIKPTANSSFAHSWFGMSFDYRINKIDFYLSPNSNH